MTVRAPKENDEEELAQIRGPDVVVVRSTRQFIPLEQDAFKMRSADAARQHGIVEAAVRLINPLQEQKAKLRNRIVATMSKIEFAEHQRLIFSEERGGESRDAADKLSKSLVQVLSSAKALNPVMRALAFVEDSQDWNTFLELAREFKKRADAIALQQVIPQKGSAKRRSAASKYKHAAMEAFKLLNDFGRKTTTTKNGDFARLAAMLAGKPRADLQHYCREFKSWRKTERK